MGGSGVRSLSRPNSLPEVARRHGQAAGQRRHRGAGLRVEIAAHAVSYFPDDGRQEAVPEEGTEVAGTVGTDWMAGNLG